MAVVDVGQIGSGYCSRWTDSRWLLQPPELPSFFAATLTLITRYSIFLSVNLCRIREIDRHIDTVNSRLIYSVLECFLLLLQFIISSLVLVYFNFPGLLT